jgi:hypothetical protein
MGLSASKDQGESKEDILYRNRIKSSQIRTDGIALLLFSLFIARLKYQIQRRYLNASYFIASSLRTRSCWPSSSAKIPTKNAQRREAVS